MFSDHLDLGAFNSLLKTRRLGKAEGWANEIWANIDSTNSRALELAVQGAAEGIVVGARQQTAGRGRLGRKWISAPDSGLYLSVLLRPLLPASAMPLFSFAAGVAVIEAVNAVCGVQPQLKWVNDIVHGGKKLGGILCEFAAGDISRHAGPGALVVGIGLNLRASEFMPAEVAAAATYLEDLANQPVDANQLAAAVVANLESIYDQVTNGKAAEMLDCWREHSVTLGKRIKITNGANHLEGFARDIADDGALLVVLSSGETVSVHAGDVSIRNADGSYA